VNRWRTQQSAISTVNCRFLWISRILNALCAMWFFHIAGLYQRRLKPLKKHFVFNDTIWSTEQSLAFTSKGFVC